MVQQLQKKAIHSIVVSPGWRTAKELRKQADEFIELKTCEFVKKRPPRGGAHNNLTIAKESITKGD